jgi:O-antigen biosynthesis protein WbqP
MYKRYGKRTLDIMLALGALAVFAVPMLAVAGWIRIDSKGPILFKQLRSGKDRKPFTVYKFRTMSTDAPSDVPTNSFGNAGSFITRSGKIMRKLSLDELPQLFNVIKGEMSVVGPRPVVLKETNLLTLRHEFHANSVKPGITGWAQVNGRDELDDIIKSRLDGVYVQQLGFKTDLKCLIMTFWTVLSVKGHSEGHEQAHRDLLTTNHGASLQVSDNSNARFGS